MAAAIEIRLASDAVSGADRAGDTDRRAAAAASTLTSTLQYRPITAEAERAPGRRTDDAVGAEPVACLKTFHGRVGAGAEDAVGANPEPTLERFDCRRLTAV